MNGQVFSYMRGAIWILEIYALTPRMSVELYGGDYLTYFVQCRNDRLSSAYPTIKNTNGTAQHSMVFRHIKK